MELSVTSSSSITQYDNVVDYNDYLIKNNKTNMTIVDYLKDINDRFYKIDISFMETFMDLIDRDDFCIPHEYLITYKVAAPGNTSKDIKKMLDSRGLEKDLDYRVGQESHPVPQGGFVKKNIYMLTPDAFKRCLQGSAITKVYSNYFLFTEKAIKYFFQYQMKVKDIKITSLENKLDLILEQNNKLQETLNQNLQETKEVKEILSTSSRDRVTDVDEEKHTETFVLLKHKTEINKYYTMRAQKEYTEKKALAAE